jgi:hypothetical protein
LRALRYLNSGLEALRAIGPPRDDCPCRNEQPRAGYDATINRLFEPDISIARPFGPQIACAGEAGQQRSAGAHRGADRAQRQRLVQHLIVPAGFIVGMKEQMTVSLDHSRGQRVARQVDDLCVRWYREMRAHSCDPLTVDQHVPPYMRDGIDPVENLRRA